MYHKRHIITDTLIRINDDICYIVSSAISSTCNNIEEKATNATPDNNPIGTDAKIHNGIDTVHPIIHDNANLAPLLLRYISSKFICI